MRVPVDRQSNRPRKGVRNYSVGRIRKLMYLLDMGNGRVSQEVINKWEAELAVACRAYSEMVNRDQTQAEREMRARQ
jgi:hypothetical protein